MPPGPPPFTVPTRAVAAQEGALRDQPGTAGSDAATTALELDGLRFHDLRHTAVALAISQGAHPKALQERMGHSSVAVTLDRYGHLDEGLDGNIATSLDDLLRRSRGLLAASAPLGEGCRHPA